MYYLGIIGSSCLHAKFELSIAINEGGKKSFSLKPLTIAVPLHYKRADLVTG